MEVTTAKQVRFSKIVETGGNPEAYLPFSDPEKDPAFMRAAKEGRVVTIKQEPTAKHKDFGIVGYVKEKFATYLIFPKTLEAFNGQRVIGIDYDLLRSADVRIGGKVSAIPKRAEPKKAKAKLPKPEPEPQPPPAKPEPPLKPQPEPKRFIAEVVVTTIDRRQVEVSAWNTKEAKAKALQQFEEELDPKRASARVVKLRKL